MPRKNKKHNPKKDASPVEDKQQTAQEPVPTASTSVPTTDYAEIHQNEAEVLRSIYGDDFEQVETRRSAWKVC